MKGFPTVLTKIHEAWEKDHEKLAEMAEGFTKALQAEAAGEVKAAGPMRLPLVGRAVAEYKLEFDEARGGFGTAPKFPRPAVFHFLLRYHLRTGDADAKRMTLATLDAMAAGGMHDQLGGGFHRYSTDARWFLPHFEKMLYDQAQLASSRAVLAGSGAVLLAPLTIGALADATSIHGALLVVPVMLALAATGPVAAAETMVLHATPVHDGDRLRDVVSGLERIFASHPDVLSLPARGVLSRYMLGQEPRRSGNG